MDENENQNQDQVQVVPEVAVEAVAIPEAAPEVSSPAPETQTETVPVTEAAPVSEAASAPAPTPAHPVRERPLVLVADDDNNFREVVTTKLQASGFDVVPAKSGDEALAKAKEVQPDLALLDINMPPGPAGTEVALQLEEQPETRGAKILFLSGQDDPFPGISGDKAAASKEIGAEDFVMKTESLDVLVAKVKAALGIV